MAQLLAGMMVGLSEERLDFQSAGLKVVYTVELLVAWMAVRMVCNSAVKKVASMARMWAVWWVDLMVDKLVHSKVDK